MGPLVVDTVEDLRSIQRSLWEVSPAGSACFNTHGCLLCTVTLVSLLLKSLGFLCHFICKSQNIKQGYI